MRPPFECFLFCFGASCCVRRSCYKLKASIGQRWHHRGCPSRGPHSIRRGWHPFLTELDRQSPANLACSLDSARQAGDAYLRPGKGFADSDVLPQHEKWFSGANHVGQRCAWTAGPPTLALSAARTSRNTVLLLHGPDKMIPCRIAAVGLSYSTQITTRLEESNDEAQNVSSLSAGTLPSASAGQLPELRPSSPASCRPFSHDPMTRAGPALTCTKPSSPKPMWAHRASGNFLPLHGGRRARGNRRPDPAQSPRRRRNCARRSRCLHMNNLVWAYDALRHPLGAKAWRSHERQHRHRLPQLNDHWGILDTGVIDPDTRRWYGVAWRIQMATPKKACITFMSSI